jgi:hypothetical protein
MSNALPYAPLTLMHSKVRAKYKRNAKKQGRACNLPLSESLKAKDLRIKCSLPAAFRSLLSNIRPRRYFPLRILFLILSPSFRCKRQCRVGGINSRPAMVLLPQ